RCAISDAPAPGARACPTDSIRGTSARSEGRARDAVQAQGDLHLQLTIGLLPASIEQRGDALQALGDGVDVDVQLLAGARQVAVVAEVGLQGADQLGAALFVVVQDRSDGASHERYDV